MKAIILAGGLGTRMREETEYKPKPMVEIGGQPVLWHIMKNFAHHGIKDFVICLGYKGEVIKEYFDDLTLMKSKLNHFQVSAKSKATHYVLPDWNVQLVDTGEETNTAGRILLAREFIGEEDFLCTYGDGLADVNVTELVKFHETHGKLATVTAVQPTSRFGLLDLDEENSVRAFSEKPVLKEWINGGYFCFKSSIYGYLDLDSPLEIGPLSSITRDRELKAFKHQGFWQPMDTYREYLELNKLWNEGQARWKTWSD